MESVQLNWFFIFCFAFAVMAPTLVTAVPLDPYWVERAKEGRRLQEYYYHPEPANVTREFTHHVVNSLKEIDLNDLEIFNGTSRKLLGATKTKVKSTISKAKNGATKVKTAKAKSSLTKGKSTKALKGSKALKYAGGCKAINPIDKCWRCRSDWHTDRKRLADCALGFGSRATGGKAGRFYTVTDPSDDDFQNPKPGTLRYAVTRTEPLWIIFERSMDISLKQELIVTSHKTIDGRGAGVTIVAGGSFVLQSVENVIIHNLKIRDTINTPGGMIRSSETHVGIRGSSEGDGVSIFQSSNIWIDHVSFFKCADGMIDIIQGSTAVTISNCHFTDHNEVLLFGARDGYEPDKKMQISLAFNHFGKRLIQRMPRVRHGFVHVVNNDYTHWEKYAIGGSSNPTIISQGNRYIANPNPQLAYAALITHRDYAPESEWKKWTWRSDGDVFLHGARFVESGDPDGARKFAGEDHVVAQSGTMVTALTQFAGVLGCRKNQPC